MDRKYLFAMWLMFCGGLNDQLQSAGFQFFSISGGGRTLTQDSLPVPPPEAGKPFSATASTKVHETLANGTQNEMTATVLQYRDAEGRVRTEGMRAFSSSSNGRGASGHGSAEAGEIVIRDRVAGVTYVLDPLRKSAVKAPIAGSSVPVARVGGSKELIVELSPRYQPSRNDTVEDLGTMTINGAPARGTRTTTIIPAGAIGNDKELRSTSERWFSPDLNLLIKSVSIDPRFGTTTYELTNISRLPPDPALFQVPADYVFAR
jgi:hypothetical protein